MSSILHLTTPPMTGPRVSELQKLLQVRGWYGGSVDGEFGILTYQSVYRAKYWLGYLQPDHVAGDLLFSFLRGTRPPSVRMRAIASLRRRNAPKVSKGTLMVREACRHLGTKESPPNSNIVLFTHWYGFVGAWCAMFVSYCGVMAGVKPFKAGSWVAYVPFIVDAARRGDHNLVIAPKQGVLRDGDIPCYDWPGESPGTADHTGIHALESTLSSLVPVAFEDAVRNQGHLGPGEFWAVEGNTAFGNDSNGGEVLIRRRHLDNVILFARPTG